MKNILLITCVLIFNLSFSQKDVNALSEKIFYSNIEENHYIPTYDFFALEKQKELQALKTIKVINNSEGKFPLYSHEDQSLFDFEGMVPQKSILNLNSITSIKNNNDFLDQVILKILNDKKINIVDFQNSSDFNGDKNYHFYNNYATDVNKLIIAYQLKGETDFQIGMEINNFINKILKTEIDKTLQNSINLFAINF
ncbi:hypothetical protein BST83_03115 [Polaribacter filamentus]|uniref:Uncharacterized protein n=1 Tax=Polaribacter filamentus TaxID=53483 RepID=A0A2S7KUG6_9FLAO|nr:hypothetical protein [Polaribacter filamentus]PQB06281.1 hypothetical protein BST83_03115 [Polaribacter filamentus]